MRRSGNASLGQRLSRWLALQSLLVLAIVCGVVYAATALNFETRQSEVLQQKEAQVRHLLSEAAGGLTVDMLRHKLDDFLIGHQDLSLRLQRSDGTTFYAKAPELPAVPGQREARFTTHLAVDRDANLSATLTLDTRNDQRLLRRVGLTLLLAALAGAALVSAGGYALVRRGLRPVRDLVNQTRLLAANTLNQRLDGSGQPEELQALVEQFNALLSRLERAYEQLEGFNDDVAHELCTPLATLIGTTELALRKARGVSELRDVLGSNLEDLQRITRIVQDMQFLSQADRGAMARREPVESLAGVALHLADYHEAALAEAQLSLVVVGDASGSFDIPLLQRALSNLLANATRYGRKGTVVRIEITAQADAVLLVVVNSGTPIEAKHLPRLFDRFYRADGSRSDSAQSHGLGLSIVAAIARMHGGEPLASSDRGVTSIGMRLQACAATHSLEAATA